MDKEMQKLEALTKAIEEAGVDIATDYKSYCNVCFAVANDVGEQGWDCLRRICSLSDKWDESHCRRLFENALKKKRNENSLGTVAHYARECGVKVDGQWEMCKNLPAKVEDVACDDGAGEDPCQDMAQLPRLPEHDWPRLLQDLMGYGTHQAQRDIIWLGALTALGASVNRLVYIPWRPGYAPCLQTFVVAPSTSGKGALAWVRQLVEPIHAHLLRQYQIAHDLYDKQMAQWSILGKQRGSTPMPKAPKQKMFLIAGNNSGTGLLQNIIDSDGVGLICETEADTVSNSIKAEYGQWGDMLRNSFDHAKLCYNRRMNREYAEVTRSYLGVLLSGTPSQVAPLIPTRENGLFARQVFYFMPAATEWIDQWEDDGANPMTDFLRWGEKWQQVLHLLKASMDRIRFRLTKSQQERFSKYMNGLFTRSLASADSSMAGVSARMAINILRIMSMVSLLRVLEPFLYDDYLDSMSQDQFAAKLKDSALLEPWLQTGKAQGGNTLGTVYQMGISDADLDVLLRTATCLLAHSRYALTLVPEKAVDRHPTDKFSAVLYELPADFTTQQAKELAAHHGIGANLVDRRLSRLCKEGKLEKVRHGHYQFVQPLKESA